MAKEVPKKTMILESSAHSEFYSEWAFLILFLTFLILRSWLDLFPNDLVEKF